MTIEKLGGLVCAIVIVAGWVVWLAQRKPK